jgi:hypothetical protein
MIHIISNASKWIGETPDAIDAARRAALWGNFLNVSHLFEIDTDDGRGSRDRAVNAGHPPKLTPKAHKRSTAIPL